MTTVVTLLSLNGGTGRTSLAANLGATFAERGDPVLVVECDPANQLGAHFGLRPGERFGLASGELTTRGLRTFQGRSRATVPFLPFGATTLQQLVAMEHEARQATGWLRRRIEPVAPEHGGCVIIDAPAGRGLWTRQALYAADVVLVVLRADAASYATLVDVHDLLEDILEPDAAIALRYLVNRFDERHALSRDVVASLRNALGELVLPVRLLEDESVREALAQQRLVAQVAAGTQFLHDVRALAEALVPIIRGGDPQGRRRLTQTDPMFARSSRVA